MALDFQVQQFPFRLGLSEGQDPHQVPPGTLTTAENAVWRQGGRLEKRFGISTFTTTTSGTAATGCSRLFTRGPELCMTDGTGLFAYSPGAARWRNVGAVPNVGLTWRTLLDTAAGVAMSDVAISAAGLMVVAYVPGDPTTTPTGNVFVTVVDPTSLTPLMAPTQVVASGVTKLRVLTIGTTAIIVTLNGANVTAYTIDLTATTPSPSAGTNLRTDAAGSMMDACVIASTFVVVYGKAGSTELYSYNTSLVQQATATVEAVASTTGGGGVAGASGEVLYVVYGSLRVAIHNSSTLAQIVAPATVEALAGGQLLYASVCRYDSTHGLIAYTASAASGPGRTVTYQIPSTGTVTTTSERGTWGTALASRPFMLGSACYVYALDFPTGSGTTTSAFQGINLHLMAVDVSTKGAAASYVPHRLVGMTELLVGSKTNYGMLPNVSALSSTDMVAGLGFLSAVPQSGTTWRCGVRLVTASTGATRPADMWRSFPATEAYFVGGALSVYDGSRVLDYGYPRAPYNSTLAAAGAAGSLVAGTYLYAFHREYRTASGMLHRGPTVTVSITAAASNTVTANLYSVNIGNKTDLTSGFGSSAPSSEQIIVYRSTVGGTVYQRLTYDPTFNTITVTQTSQAQALSDGRSDANIDGASTTLASRPAIYTTGGILDDYAPPASVTMFHHADRLFVLAGDQLTWWYSKAFQDDAGVAPGFHPNFRIIFDETQVAGASMDDKAIFFSATGVRYMQGLGPAANGQNSDFGVPVQIQTDVGCTNARSVVGTPDGVMFQSARGIYLLTRGLELAWIGRPVKDTLASYPVVTSAVLVAKHNQVRFTCNNTGGTAGVVLVYDYVEKQWSTFRHTAGGYSYGCPYADACIYGNEWTFATPNGSVCQESSTSYKDDSTWVPLTLETAWISAAGPMAFQSVRTFGMHGTSYTDHDLTIQVGFDNDTAYAQTASFAATTPAVAVGSEEPEVVIGTRRKCSVIRFKITDATPSAGTVGTGQGPAFDMMAMEVGIKRGLGNAPATKRR